MRTLRRILPRTGQLPVLAANALIVMFGGLGARTRRGFGQLRVDHVDGATERLPGMWGDTNYLQPPDTEQGWRTLLDNPCLPDMEVVDDHGWNDSANQEPANREEHADAVPEWPTLRPKWIRPVPLGDRGWRVMTFVFWCRLLPENATLTADGDAHGKELDIPDDAAHTAWSAWIPPTGRVQRRLPKNYYDPTQP